MSLKKCLVGTLIFALLISVVFSVCLAGIKAGDMAPEFKVVSGDNEILGLEDIKGKLAVIFYETKDTTEKNRQLKDELNRFYDKQPDRAKKLILRISVINCEGVIFKAAWRNSLKQSSIKEGITIYGDWDGKMFDAYGIKDRESNLIIIGRDGKVKYSFAGRAQEKDFGNIRELLKREAGSQ